MPPNQTFLGVLRSFPSFGRNLLTSPQSAQTDEPDLPSSLCQDGLPRERNSPKNARLVSHVELAETVEFQRESIRAQIVEQGGLQARDNRGYDVLGFFLGRQR
jgi:hypothetical protein